MQLIAEAYAADDGDGSASAPETGRSLRRVERRASSTRFLIEITADILRHMDPDTGKPLVDVILDTAGQKGTGKWTVISALDLGMPVTLDRRGGVRARHVGAQGRARARGRGPARPDRGAAPAIGSFVEDVRDALYASQDRLLRAGLHAAARRVRGVQAGTSTSAASRSMWRGGCIIRAAFLGDITKAFEQQPGARQPAGRSLLHERRRPRAGRLAATSSPAPSNAGVPVPAYRVGAGLLRQLPLGEAAREPPAGAARLLRRPHLRARRQAARPVLPHRLDRPWRRHDRRVLPGVTCRSAPTPFVVVVASPRETTDGEEGQRWRATCC